MPIAPAGASAEAGAVATGLAGTGSVSLQLRKPLLKLLYALLEGRNAQRPEGSYTTYLFEKGREKILKKVGEECTEVIIGAMKGSREETIYEISDLCYHVLVLMVAEGITLDDIRAELASRHVIDHKVKQETMQ